MTKRLPLELTGGQAQHIALLADEVSAIAIEQAKNALLSDARFENIRNLDDRIWHFVAKCWVDRETDHAPAFLERHAEEPTEVTCYYRVRQQSSGFHPTAIPSRA